MFKQLLPLVVFLTGAHAIPLTLEDILNHAKQTQLLTQTIDEEQQALEAKNLANSADAPLVLYHGLTRANSKGISGYEYDVALSKAFKLGNIQALEQQQKRLENEAHKLEQEKFLVDATNRLKNLYHQHCLDVHYKKHFQQSVNDFVRLYQKKEKAFKHDEIAKTELLQLELEKRTLETTLANLNQKTQNAKAQLLSLTTLDSSDMLSCQDLYPITQSVTLNDQAFQLSQRAHEKRIESTQVGLNRYAKSLESVEVSMGYTKELETDLYSVGVAIPLNFSSNKSEQERATLMHQSTALTLQNEQQLAHKTYQLHQLQDKLNRLFQTITAQETNINDYKIKLLPLMKKSYDYGESSVIEYLLSRQKLTQLQQGLLEQQKGYYSTLFELYSTSEMKEQ